MVKKTSKKKPTKKGPNKKKVTKKKVGKKKSSVKKARKKNPSKRWSWKKIFLVSGSVLLIFLILLGIFLFFHIRALNHQVRTQFEGKRWELAARVYARPLELYPAKRLGKQQLSEELGFLMKPPNQHTYG